MRRDRARAKRSESIKPKSPWLEKVTQSGRSKVFGDLDALTRNPETSARLVAHARALNPDRSLEWCAEKAVYDIERDRMAR